MGTSNADSTKNNDSEYFDITIRNQDFYKIQELLSKGDISAIKALRDLYGKTEQEYQYFQKLLSSEETDEDAEQKIKASVGSRENLITACMVIERELEKYRELLGDLSTSGRNFNKKVCFANIRYLLDKNPSVKIGQIEKEAGLRLGYMARLEKPDNTAEPSVEFIVSAAKLLKVSLDSLMLVDMTALSSTEEYLRKFLEKLQKDTQKDTISWENEPASYLNDSLKNVTTSPDKVHDLFTVSVEQVKNSAGYFGHELYFASNAFGLNTFFAGDCFNCEILSGTKVYLINVGNSNIPLASNNSTIEIWMSSKNGGSQFLIGDQEGSPLAPLVKSLYALAQEQDRHPKIKDTLRAAIDEYLESDIPF